LKYCTLRPFRRALFGPAAPLRRAFSSMRRGPPITISFPAGSRKGLRSLRHVIFSGNAGREPQPSYEAQGHQEHEAEYLPLDSLCFQCCAFSSSLPLDSANLPRSFPSPACAAVAQAVATRCCQNASVITGTSPPARFMGRLHQECRVHLRAMPTAMDHPCFV
jgi:hypothetical protein